MCYNYHALPYFSLYLISRLLLVDYKYSYYILHNRYKRIVADKIEEKKNKTFIRSFINFRFGAV